jgi:hypothetical protein
MLATTGIPKHHVMNPPLGGVSARRLSPLRRGCLGGPQHGYFGYPNYELAVGTRASRLGSGGGTILSALGGASLFLAIERRTS